MTTKEEFNNFLDKFGKDAGDFTDEELYQIGCKYKELPTSQKRWDELVKILGVDKTGEQFRSWIKGKQYADGTITSNVKLLSDQTIDNISFPEFEEKTEEIKRELYKQQVKTRDVMNSYRRSLRDDARVEVLNDLIKEGVKELNNLPSIEYTGIDSEENNEAVMLLSDLHVGMEINNFYNKYNTEIARKRVKKYVHDTIELCKKNNIQRLNVLNLGDMIDGQLRVTSRIEDSEDLVSQIMIASEILADALNELQEAAPEIIYRSCSDNHSRVTPNFKENIEKENYFRLIDFYLEARLKDTKVKFTHDNLDVDLGLFSLLNGKKMAFAHGHREKINTCIQGILGATRQFCDYVCVGHWHESKMKSFQGAKVFVNSSICGSDNYAQSLRLYGDAEQTLLIFHNGNLSVNYINLNIYE